MLRRGYHNTRGLLLKARLDKFGHRINQKHVILVELHGMRHERVPPKINQVVKILTHVPLASLSSEVKHK
jgi:hypothetical protein